MRGAARLIEQAADVLVVGGGHAGVEAALAAARRGAATILICPAPSESIGELACNPSVGGIGKGILVREVDALGGALGKVADSAGIHFRELNSSRGAAVRGPRVQVDRRSFKKNLQDVVFAQKNLQVVDAKAVDLLVSSNSNRIHGLKIEDNNGSFEDVLAPSVVIATGTFLGGKIHIGKRVFSGGRLPPLKEFVDQESSNAVAAADQQALKSANGLTLAFTKANVQLGRLKTGTPPRLLAQSIDTSVCELHASDSNPVPLAMSSLSEQDCAQGWRPVLPQTACWKTGTNSKTAAVVSLALTEGSGAIYDEADGRGVGPRYCPSLETKILRFPERTHRIWLEPEGLDCSVVYPSGLSMALDPQTQKQVIRSIQGLQEAEILRPGYGVEYNFVDPRQLRPTLELKNIQGLYLAGQINGTTGYEEAAAQGLVAGCNAACPSSPLVMSRTDGYIGVLIDDLISKGVSEPYRMLTSRAEFRLSLRADNADRRLLGHAESCGLLCPTQIVRAQSKVRIIAELESSLSQIKLPSETWRKLGVRLTSNGRYYSAFQILSQHGTTLSGLMTTLRHLMSSEAHLSSFKVDDFGTKEALAYLSSLSREYLLYASDVEIESKYKWFIQRQAKEIENLQKEMDLKIPPDLNYNGMDWLSSEEIEKLSQHRPRTVSNALSIEGVKPSSVIQILQSVRNQS